MINDASRIALKCFTTKSEIIPISGSNTLCLVFSINLSQTRIIDGNTVTHPNTPNTTPFAITTPKSNPSVKLIKHKATKPATVVIELPTTEVIVFDTACAIALLWSSPYLS